MNRLIRSLRLAVIALAVFVASNADAQTNQSGLVSATPGGTAANYYFAKPGDITILVEVWGSVDRPGRYEIASTINLVNLLSLAGGPSEEARIDNIRITRLAKGTPPDKRQVLTVDLEDLTNVKQDELLLQPGDIIFVDSLSWSSWTRRLNYVLPVLSLTLSVIQLYLLLTR